MQSYLVEIYAPRSRAGDVSATTRRVGAAVAELSSEGVPIRHVRTTFLPDDEMCFHLVEASSAGVVDELCRRAGLGRVRVVVAVET
jgi:hypothetical protein